MRRHRERTMVLVIISVVAVIAIAAAVLILADKKENFRVFGGNIKVENNIDDSEEETQTIRVLNMFITPEQVAEDKDNVILQKSENIGQGYLNNCVFLGDSRTVAMVNFACVNDDDALAQIGISHMAYMKNTFTNNAGKQYTLKSYLASHQKPVIYISLGVNGMNGISEEDYEKSFTNLIDYCIEAAPDSSIVLMSIWPVDDNGPYKKSVQNAWISKYNDFLFELAKEKKIHFLNINEILTSDSGQIKAEYDAGDGLHYNKKAYDAIMDYIISHPVPGVSVDGEYTVKYIKPRVTNTEPAGNEEGGLPMDDEALMQLYQMMLSGEGQNQVPSGDGTVLPGDAGGNSAMPDGSIPTLPGSENSMMNPMSPDGVTPENSGDNSLGNQYGNFGDNSSEKQDENAGGNSSKNGEGNDGGNPGAGEGAEGSENSGEWGIDAPMQNLLYESYFKNIQ